MQIPRCGNGGKYSERPPLCPRCISASWWNGTRIVSAVRKRNGLIEHHTGIIYRRAYCRCKDCPQKSWTVYPQDDSYPHRLFRLDVILSAVTAVVMGGQSMTAAARAHLCGRDSIRRWVDWISHLSDPDELMRACSQLEPRGVPGAAVSARLPRAMAVLYLLDRLGELLTERGVRLPMLGSGLVRVLKDQLARFARVFYLTKLSPPLRADLSRVRL
jgi:transposase-like protein